MPSDAERIANELLKPIQEKRRREELEAERVAAAQRREQGQIRREQLRLEAEAARKTKDWSKATDDEVSRELRRLGVTI
jgi:hypothetical protein